MNPVRSSKLNMSVPLKKLMEEEIGVSFENCTDLITDSVKK